MARHSGGIRPEDESLALSSAPTAMNRTSASGPASRSCASRFLTFTFRLPIGVQPANASLEMLWHYELKLRVSGPVGDLAARPGFLRCFSGPLHLGRDDLFK